jgi:hypothetical protein
MKQRVKKRNPMVRVLKQMAYGFVFLVVAGTAARAQIVEREWLQIFANAAGDEVIYDVAFTASGDIIAVGKKAVSGVNTDILVRKLSGTDGSLVWEYITGDTGLDEASALSIASDGSIFVVGSFEGVVSFDPPFNSVDVDVRGLGRAMFILKLNADGSFNDVKHVKGASPTDAVFAKDIKLQGSSLFVGGEFVGSSVDFNWQSGGNYLFSSGSAAGFVVKGAQDLSFSWAKELGGTSGSDVRLSSLTVDGSGAVYATGFFDGTNVDFGGTNLSSVGGPGNPDAWVAKIDATGAVSWAGSFGATPAGNFGHAIAFDAQGKLWVAGRINGNADINPDPAGTYTVSATQDGGILFNIDPATGKLANLPSPLYYLLDGGNNEEITNVALGPSGEIYLRGYFQGNVSFDPFSPGYIPYPSTFTNGTFLAKLYNDSGTLRLVYARGFIGGLITGKALAQQNDKVVFAGGFYSTVDFDPTLSGTYNHTPASGADAFVYLQKPLARYDFAISDGITANPIAGAEVNIETETVTTSASGVATFALPAGTFNYVVSGPASSNYIPYLSTLTVSAVSNAPNYEAITLCPLETPSFDIYVVSPNVVAEVKIYASSPSCDYTATEYEVEISETLDFAAVQTIVAPNDPAADPTIASLSGLSLLPDKQYYVRVKARNTAEGKESNYAPPRAFVYTEKPTATEPARFVRIFPVPAHDYLQIELLRPAQQLRVYDITGREWASRKSWSTTPLTIDMQPWPQGVYFVEVIFEDLPPLVQKVVKW